MPVPKNRRAALIRSLKKLGCDDNRIKILTPEIDHIVWLEQKIDQARELIADADIIEEYQNGPNQHCTRKHPAYDALHKMVTSYNQCLRTIVDAVAPAPVQVEAKVTSQADIIKKKDIMMALRRAEEERHG